MRKHDIALKQKVGDTILLQFQNNFANHLDKTCKENFPGINVGKEDYYGSLTKDL